MADRKLLVFCALNIVQGVLVGMIPLAFSSRVAAFNWILAVASVSMLVAGPALLLGGRYGRIFAAFACLLHGTIGTVLAALLAGSASYLYGIYGHHGHALGTIAFVFVGVGLIFFWLIPGHELHYLRNWVPTEASVAHRAGTR